MHNLIVIRDPQPWTEELRRTISQCERSWAANLHASEEWLTLQAEKAVFVSAFIIRKLMDSNKFEPHVKQLSVTAGLVSIRQPAAELPSYLTWQEVDEYYDFERISELALRLRDLVNRLIHSYAFLVVGAYDSSVDDPFGFYFNSDHTRIDELLYLEWATYKEVVRRAEDGVIRAR